MKMTKLVPHPLAVKVCLLSTHMHGEAIKIESCNARHAQLCCLKIARRISSEAVACTLYFRNWLVTEPSCGHERCAALFYRPSTSAGQKEGTLFKWTDYNCNSKKNFICKYSEGKTLLLLFNSKYETSIF